MSIDAQILGNGKLAGGQSSLEGYTITEDAGPISMTDSSGGVGTISFNALDDDSRFGTMLLLGSSLQVNDGQAGMVVGNVRGLSSDGGIVQVDANSRLDNLVINISANSVYTNFGDAIRYYFALAGITETLAVHESLEDIPITAPGWTGDLWTHVKELCAYVGAESPTLVRDAITIRPIRQRTIKSLRAGRIRWRSSYDGISQAVRVTNWNNRYVQDGPVYPKTPLQEGQSVENVDAGEVRLTNIATEFYIESIIQPEAKAVVGEFEIGGSMYCVSDDKGVLVDPLDWTRDGGDVNFSIGPDRKSVNVRIIGASGATGLRGPFRLGVLVSENDYRSSLRIAGTGISYSPEVVESSTGASATSAPQAMGPSIESVFVGDASGAMAASQAAVAVEASPRMSLSVTGASIKSVTDESQPFNFATFADFNAHADEQQWETIADFNAAMEGESFGDFNDFWYKLVESGFANQLFGNVAGARLPYRRAFYRIRSARITPLGVDFDAEGDTTFADFNESAGATSMTFADFNESYAGMTFSEFSIIPLPNELPEYDIV